MIAVTAKPEVSPPAQRPSDCVPNPAEYRRPPGSAPLLAQVEPLKLLQVATIEPELFSPPHSNAADCEPATACRYLAAISDPELDQAVPLNV